MKSTEKEFLNLIEQNQNIVHKVCNIYTATQEDHTDLFQEIMLQLWKAFPKFRGEAKLTTWMYRISLYTAISGYKKARLRKQLSQNIPIELTEAKDPYANYAFEDLNIAINTLSDTDKALIMLYLDERPYKEIADIMEISESNVGVKLNRIKKKLKSVLTKT